MASKEEVDVAISRYLKAYASVPFPSASASVARYGELGCRVVGGRTPGPLPGCLLEAEVPLSTCTDSERQLFREKYWTGMTMSEPIVREVNGVRTEYRVPVWRSNAEVAKAVGAPSAGAVKKRLRIARRKVAAKIDEMKG